MTKTETYDNRAFAGLSPLPGIRVRARWFAVQCLANRESAAAAHLRSQDFAVFLPCRERTRRHARRLETVLTPYFPSYLFVQLDLERDRWRSVNGTYGVARIVMQGDAPAPAPLGVVETLKAACDDKGILKLSPDFKPGQSVRLLAGAFADAVGELERLDDAGRVRVLLKIMGGRVPIVLAQESIISANES